MRVYSIGHSTRSLESMFQLLREQGVNGVVDVRRYPGSRRYPHFSKEALSASLTASGWKYRHEPSLGGRRTPRVHSPNTAWRNAGFRGYADYMSTADFRDALERLIAESRSATIVIMCAEAVPWRCHRQLIADALVARGLEVKHILGPGRADPHRLTGHATVTGDGVVTYPGHQARGAF